jgi:hypothetical protein
MPTTISDLFDLIINNGLGNDGCDLNLYIFKSKELASFGRHPCYQLKGKLIPKEFSDEYKTIIVFDNDYKYKHKDELPCSIDFFGYEAFREFLFKYKPENMPIEEFLDPIIRSGYKDIIDFDYVGLTYVMVSDSKAFNDPDLEETIKKKTEEYFQKENPDQILLEMFGYNKFKDPKVEQNHRSHHKFVDRYAEVSFIGMTYKLFVHNQYIEDPRSLINIFMFDKMSEELGSINDQHVGRFILPFRIKLRLEKDIKSSCPPFSKELEVDTIYKDGVPMDSKAIPKIYRLSMDFLKYHDKLEVTQRLKSYRRGAYEQAENFLQIRQDCSHLNLIEKRIREAVKGDSNLTNEAWLSLIIRCAMFLDNGLSLHKDGINESFLSSPSKELDISKDSGFGKDFRLHLFGAGDSKMLLSPNSIIEKLSSDLEDLKTWTEGFKEIVHFMKTCFSEEEMNIDLTMEDFVIKVLGRTVPTDPLSVINSINRVENHELCSYLKPAAKIARELL